MGRELKRKQSKREKGKIEKIKVVDDSNNELQHLLKVFVGVLVVIVIAYLLVGIFVTKEIKWFEKKEKPVVNISSTNILASEIFRMKEETYYVYCYDFSKTYHSIESSISNKLSSDKVYKVDISSEFNTKYIGEVGNPNASNKDELRLVNPTLIKVESNKITLYLEGEDNIKNHFVEE